MDKAEATLMDAERSERTATGRKLARIGGQAVGLDVKYPVASGGACRRVYLDSTASTLRLKIVQDVLDAFQPHYANTHSTLHYAARLSTAEYSWAHDVVLDFVGANPEQWMCFFVGSGATAALNRVAQTLRAARPGRDVVLTSVMEHHSNDLPHRKHFTEVVHVPAEVTSSGALGGIDLLQLENELKARPSRVNYVAVTGVSNVTGIVNPIHKIAQLAHRYGALVVVDAAQMAAHVPMRMSDNAEPSMDLDVVVFSGHKVYAPGSPGVVVARRALFAGVEPAEVGGGMVKEVSLDRYAVADDFPTREEAGTPNVSGAIGLAAALYALKEIGMENVWAEEDRVLRYALRRLREVPGLMIYGETNPDICQRAGAISFNLEQFDHALTAAVLNDYFNIAVRNECFCAHPYVREMIMIALSGIADTLSNAELERMADAQRGMVRASFGIYNTEKDVDSLIVALKSIVARRAEFERLYVLQPNGDYKHMQFSVDMSRAFSARTVVDAALRDA